MEEKEESDVTTSDVSGVADMSLEIKWRIYETDHYVEVFCKKY